MNREFAVKVSVAFVVGVNCDGRISEQGFGSSSSDDDFLVGTFERVGERSDDSEFDLVFDIVSGDGKESSSRNVLLIDLLEDYSHFS